MTSTGSWSWILGSTSRGSTGAPSALGVDGWRVRLVTGGKVDSAGEVLLLIKTRTDLLPDVETTIAGLHSYQVPEFLVLVLGSGTATAVGPSRCSSIFEIAGRRS